MRNRLYGGVRGQVNTKRGEHLRLVFTSYSILRISRQLSIFVPKFFNMKRAVLAVLLFLSLAPLAWAQRTGSNGFSPLFNPEFKSELPDEVKETSGLFFHNGRLWTHNDSGGKPILYALDTMTFEVVQKVTLSNVKNNDWEDVSSDGENVFVGDFGNNKGNRKNLRIYSFPLSSIPDEGNATIKVDSICFTF